MNNNSTYKDIPTELQYMCSPKTFYSTPINQRKNTGRSRAERIPAVDWRMKGEHGLVCTDSAAHRSGARSTGSAEEVL